MSRKQINVRLSEEEYEKLEELARSHNKAKSEIVRTAFKGELATIDARKNKSLSDEERKDMLVKIGTMMTYLSDVRNHATGVGRNVNQITKLAHQGKIGTDQGVDKYLAYSENMKENLEVMAKELDRIWHTLV